MLIIDLKPGDEVAGWMKMGRALKSGVHKDGSIYGYVPTSPVTAKNTDLSRFVGQVVKNDISSLTLTLNVCRAGFRVVAQDNEAIQVAIPYTMLQRLRVFSASANVPQSWATNQFPTHTWQMMPYRTLSEVILRW